MERIIDQVQKIWALDNKKSNGYDVIVDIKNVISSSKNPTTASKKILEVISRDDIKHDIHIEWVIATLIIASREIVGRNKEDLLDEEKEIAEILINNKICEFSKLDILELV